MSKVDRVCIQCNKGFTVWKSQLKYGGAKYCSQSCRTKFRNKGNSWNLGKKRPAQSEFLKKAIAEGKFKPYRGTGKDNPNWRGGVSSLNHRLRTSKAYKVWRSSVLERDNHTCIECSSVGDLTVDHIKPFAKYEDLRFEVSNGRTLCRPCHKKLDPHFFNVGVTV